MGISARAALLRLPSVAAIQQKLPRLAAPRDCHVAIRRPPADLHLRLRLLVSAVKNTSKSRIHLAGDSIDELVMADFQHKGIEQRVQDTVARALGIQVADGSTPLRMGSTPNWDSMGHMAVVMELEREFQTSFPSYRLPELVDVQSIAKAIQEAQT